MDWKAYKQAAALPFEVLDCQVAVEKMVEGKRGDHRIDVWIEAEQYGVKTRCLIDCRHWDTPVTKAEVFALKQVMKDVRGDRALMLSNAGFDSGATKAARSTSITLTTLEAIQDSAEQELTHTTLISLENRITKLKQSLERLSESVQVAPGLWQTQPKPGVEADWVAKTTEALEAIKFGFAKARLQQPPYFVQKDETTGQPQLFQTIEEFVTQAAGLITAAEGKLKQQHQQITQARLAAPATETAEATKTDSAQATDGEAKPKRSLHAAFFRRKVSTPPVKFAQKGDRPQRAGGASGSSPRNNRKFAGGKPEAPSQRRQNSSDFRPGPSEMGPVRSRPGGSRFESKRGPSRFNESSHRSASVEKPRLAGDSSRTGDRAKPANVAPPKLKPEADRGQQQTDSYRHSRAEGEHQSSSAGTSQEPALTGRWWDEPEPRFKPRQRSGDRPPRRAYGKPRLSGRKAPRFEGQKFGGKQFGSKTSGRKPFGAKKFGSKKVTPKPVQRGEAAAESYPSGERYRQARRFGERPSGGKFSDRSDSSGSSHGNRKFAGKRTFSGGKPRSFKGNRFPGSQFARRKPGMGGNSPVAKPKLRQQSDASGSSSSADKE